MKGNARWYSGQGVAAAMARATRRIPKRSADEAADDVHDDPAAPPHFLTFALQTFEQQQRPQSRAVRSALSSSSTISAFIECAHAASVSSFEKFQQLLNQKSECKGAVEDRDAVQLDQLTDFSPYCGSADAAVPQRDDSPIMATSSHPPPSSARSADQSRKELAAAARAYKPTLHTPLLQCIASRLAVSDTLLLAKQLVRYLHEAAAAEGSNGGRYSAADFNAETSITTAKGMELLRRAMDVCRVRYANPSQKSAHSNVLPTSNSLWAFSTATRESAGIAARLHHTTSLATHGQRCRRPLPHCFLRYVSDVQVNEVLPSGAVVVFTQPTHPAEVGDRATVSPVAGERGKATTSDPKRRNKLHQKPFASFRDSVESCLTSSPAELHVHCVLYRCGVPMAAAIASLVDAAEGHIQREDVHVNLTVPENDEHVVVQLCSVRIEIPIALRGKGYTDQEEAVQHCLHVARTLAHVNVDSEENGKESKPKVGLQLLHCRPHSCPLEWHGLSHESASTASQLQYAFLLRGFHQRGGPADQLDRTALLRSETIPNFFSPFHFGPAAVPFFRTYHVTAALERGQYAEAAAMTLCLACGAETPLRTPSAPPTLAPWLEQALHFLCRGEEREGAWQTWWMQHVPVTERSRLLSAKAELLWNVLASCRLQGLAAATNGRGEALMAASPEPGDFVRCNRAATTEEECEREPLAAESSIPQRTQILPVYDRSQAARYTVHDIVLPVVCDAASNTTGCESVAEVEAQLGFAVARRLRRCMHQQSSLSFRPLLVGATGHPCAARPWTRSFQEPSSGAALNSVPTVFTLATDWELVGNSRHKRDYAAKSRGPRAQVWPLSKRGRTLSDRLPVGLLAVASASGSSLLGTETGLPRRHASRCLAVHCTLPADMSLSNYLCEFATVEDLRAAS
ncbi:hypothetical protein ABL78_7588 [Leptomonas seymouri]|uniref:Uncharacterized protein n=1 Tax=Leptomonas seymouri TaxID=5684 RepID=A0A0N1I0E0_LEPSE|nr:hypothetical protein ABL78_7588 [Leptomonas seymouri]|eukprot:KPI83373.1 hypothetical protein ABL78_7588 [Leptomonas seymouri]